ncbi:sensor histidine kinase [Herbidospora mongoliensis]|uniref:sensor histidine kinase n=1 Tax=Herbidospora mongoliensis TaxID=688067 RepID=UPI001471EDFC|nr:sensor histidine kinase [Herbidospora mongoliensis]
MNTAMFVLRVPLFFLLALPVVVWGVSLVLGRKGRRRNDACPRQLPDERARIARELHDIVAFHMSVIAVQAATAPYRIEDGVSEEVSREFQTINVGARESLREMRQLLSALRHAGDAPSPGLADLPRLVESTRHAGLAVRLTIADPPHPPGPAVSLTAYRIIQEALSNVVRHATGAPTAVRVRTNDAGDRLLVEVENGRPGADLPDLTSARSGFGLVGMRERVAALGGELTTGSDGHGGFTVSATLPLAATR